VAFIKRYMGKDDYRQVIGGKAYRPEEISAYILAKLVADAEARLKEEGRLEHPIKRVIITIPAYFGAREQLATKQAGEAAKLEVVEIIKEPTAAAMSYFTEREHPNETVLVYDLGGGTFDITLMKAVGPEMQELVIKGDDRRGGYDWDLKLLEIVASRFALNHPEAADLANDADWKNRNIDKAENCKKSLTSKPQTTFAVMHGTTYDKVEIKREEFAAQTEGLLEETVQLLGRVLEIAEEKGFDPPRRLLLVGGSTRMPMVQARLKQFLADRSVEILIHDPDQAVAKGAAFLGFIKRIQEVIASNGGDFALLIERFPNIREFLNRGTPEPETILARSLGVKVHENGTPNTIVSHLLHQNDPLPMEVTKTFYTVEDYQTGVLLQILEQNSAEESSLVPSNRQIAEITIPDLGPMRLLKNSPVEVTIRMERDLTGTATGREPKSGKVVQGTFKVEGLPKDVLRGIAEHVSEAMAVSL
jgi:molecular chaperone DnaK (HSP70)